MPIRPENRSRYPADWNRISQRVRDDAENRCEFCGVENHAMIYRGTHDDWPAYRYRSDTVFEESRCAATGNFIPGSCWDDFDGTGATVKIILTVAHLDHQPENCTRENLRALCQMCHNIYDAPARAAGRAERANAKKSPQPLGPGEFETGRMA